MASSQIHQVQNQANPTSIETLESSVGKLIKIWDRRQKWQLFFNPTGQEILNNNKKAPWRTHLSKFLESTPVRIVAVLLLLLDLLITVFELSFSMYSCSSDDKEKEGWYHWVGIAILSLLSIKIVALAVGLGGSFIRRPGYVVDGVVLAVALVLEAVLRRKGGGLIVVVSLWRVVRVIESAFELSDEAIEAQIEEIVYQFQALKEENRKLSEMVVQQDEIIQKLQQELAQFQRTHEVAI